MTKLLISLVIVFISSHGFVTLSHAEQFSSESHANIFDIKVQNPLFLVSRVMKEHPDFARFWGVTFSKPNTIYEQIQFFVGEEVNHKMAELERQIGEKTFRFKFIKPYNHALNPIEFLAEVSQGIWPLAYSGRNVDFPIVDKNHMIARDIHNKNLSSDPVVHEFATQGFLIPLLHPKIVERMKLFTKAALYLLSATAHEDKRVQELAQKMAYFTAGHMRLSVAYIQDFDFTFTAERVDRNRWSKKLAEKIGIQNLQSINNEISSIQLIRAVGELNGFFIGGEIRLPVNSPLIDSPMDYRELLVEFAPSVKGIREPAQLFAKFLGLSKKDGLVLSEDFEQSLQKLIFSYRKDTPSMPSDGELEAYVKIVLGVADCNSLLAHRAPPHLNTSNVIRLFPNGPRI